MKFEYILLGAQALLALNFLFTGFMKLTAPKEKLVQLIGWPEDYSMKTVKFFGVWELIGAVGVVLPIFVEGIAIVTPLAATGLGLIMAGSMVVHIQREDIAKLTMSLVMFFVAVLAGFGRLLEIAI